MLMWLRLTEASSSLWPPDRKQIPGTAAGTVLQDGNSIHLITVPKMHPELLQWARFLHRVTQQVGPNPSLT